MTATIHHLPANRRTGQHMLDEAYPAEMALIGSMLLAAGERSGARQPIDLEPGEFAHPAHASIFAAINHDRAAGRSRPIEALLVEIGTKHDEFLDDVGGLRRYVPKLIQAAEAIVHEQDYALLVRSAFRRRELARIAEEIALMAMDPGFSAEEALQRAAEDIEALQVHNTTTAITFADAALQNADRLRRPGLCVSTGLRPLDDVMGGGLFGGKLYGIGARRKQGKTLMAGTIAHNVAKAGHKVVFFALEMGAVEIAQRMIAADLNVGAGRFLHGVDPRDPDSESSRNALGFANRVEDYAGRASENLVFEDRPGLPFEIMKRLIAQHAKAGAKLIVVDYLQLIGGCPPRKSKAEHYDDVAQWLADYAKKSGVCILCPGQLNRDNEFRGGDGLRLACAMYFKQEKVVMSSFEGLWLEMQDTRYTTMEDVGTEETPVLYIDRIGPTVRAIAP